MATRVLLRGDTAADLALANRRLGPGEPVVETDTHRLKVGDGVRRWLELPYFITDDEVQQLIQDAINELGSGGGGEGGTALLAHIQSTDPHPNYDDGRSFLLLYQNAKV